MGRTCDFCFISFNAELGAHSHRPTCPIQLGDGKAKAGLVFGHGGGADIEDRLLGIPSRLLETRRVGTLGHLAKFLLPSVAPTICKLIVQMPIIHDAPWESNVGGVVKSGRHFEGELMF